MILLQEILDRSGIRYRYTTSRWETVLDCPFCQERGLTEDAKEHLGLNIRNGLAHCFRCDWRSRGVLTTARALAKVFRIPFRLEYRTMQEEEVEEEKKEESDIVVPVGLPKEYEQFTETVGDPVERRVRSYLKSRQVSMMQVERHKIGFAAVGKYAWRVLFPVFGGDGKVHGCVARAVDNRQQPKYLNTPGIKLLWNGHRQAKVAVVVEGVLDALRVETALLRRRDWVAVARLGSTITSAQLAQLRAYERVICLPDRDAPGLKGTISLAKTCLDKGIHVEVAIPEFVDDRDPGDMTENEIDDYIGLAQKWSDGSVPRIRAAMKRQRLS